MLTVNTDYLRDNGKYRTCLTGTLVNDVPSCGTVRPAFHVTLLPPSGQMQSMHFELIYSKQLLTSAGYILCNKLT